MVKKKKIKKKSYKRQLYFGESITVLYPTATVKVHWENAVAAWFLEIGLGAHTGWKTGLSPVTIWVQGKIRHTYKILFGKPEGRKPLSKPTKWWENSVLKGS